MVICDMSGESSRRKLSDVKDNKARKYERRLIIDIKHNETVVMEATEQPHQGP